MYLLNTETMNDAQSMALHRMDQENVGTAAYLGISYFWAFKYRHSLRPCSYYGRRIVHKRLLDAGLDVRGESPEHDEIIEPYCASRREVLEAYGRTAPTEEK